MPLSKDPVQCTIRPARSLQEVEALWWPLMQSLGWNRALADAHTHVHSAGLSAWLMAIPTKSKEDAAPQKDKPQGTIIPFTYPNGTGWVGFFIMNAAYRGQGLGRELFAAALGYFKEQGTRFIGLDGVAEQVRTYERRGFVETDRIALMVRSGTKDVPAIQRELGEGERMVPLKDVKKEVLVQSDLEHTGLERRRLWSDEAMFSRTDASGFAVFKRKEGEDGEEVEGWILARECQDGWRIGPVYAHCKEIASLLLHCAMKSMEGKEGSLIAEVWRSNKDAVAVFEHLGWTWSGMDYHRMWVDGRVPEAQQKGGKSETEMFAIFDASEG